MHDFGKDVSHDLCCEFAFVFDVVIVLVNACHGVDCLHHVEDFGPDDELGETLDEEAEGEMEGVVDDCPELLAELWEVGVLHPVEVDEEDDVDGSCRSEDNTDGFSIYPGLVCVEALHTRKRLTPRIRVLNNSDNTLTNSNDSITNNNNRQKTHTLHQVCSLEAKDREDVCQDESKDNLNSS